MTRDESLDVVAMLVSHWPGNHWTEGSMDAYARAIEPLDADIAMRAVLRAVQELEFYPRVSVLREFVRIEKRLSEPEPIGRMLNNIPSQIMPAWVRGYVVARVRYQDLDAWPEQGDLIDAPLMPEENRVKYMTEGANIPIDALFTAIGLRE